MELTTVIRNVALVLITLGAALASAAEPRSTAAQAGKAAAHAALDEGADVPTSVPQLPQQGEDKARKALPNREVHPKGDAASHARAQAHRRADAATVDAHVEAAVRTAHGLAVTTATRDASAEVRTAAGQVRASTTKTTAANHRAGEPASGTRP